jgi:hypothetical protein
LTGSSLLPLTLALFWCFAAYPSLRYWGLSLQYPGELDWMEPVILGQANMLIVGESVYSVIDGRFVASVYGPLFYYGAALFAGLEPYAYFPLRLFSVLGLLTAILAGGFLVYRQTGSLIGAVLTGLLLPQIMSLIKFGATCKPDSVALGLTTLGLLVALPAGRAIRIYAPLPFFVLAFFVKANYIIAAPAALFVVLLLENRQRAARFALALGLPVVCIAGAFTLYFGPSYLTHQVTYNRLPFDLAKGLWGEPVRFWLGNWPLLICAATSLFVFRSRPLLLYFCFALVSVVLMGKAGANINHWTEPLYAAALLAGSGLGRLIGRVASLRDLWNPRVLGVCGGLAIFVLFHNPGTDRASDLIGAARKDRIAQERLARIVGNQRPLVFTAVPGATARMGPAVRVPIQDPFTYKELVQNGTLSGELFSANVASGAFDYVILNDSATVRERLTDEQLRLILENYRPAYLLPGTPFTEGNLVVLRPGIAGPR